MGTNIFDKISFWSLFLVITLLPIFFLPFTNIPVEIAKGTLVVVGLSISMIFWAIARFSDGNIVLPKSGLILAGFGVVFAMFLSSIFSASPAVSFFGIIFDVGSFWFMFVAFLLMLLSAMTFRDSKRVVVLLIGMVFSSLFVLAFQTLYLFLPKFFALGVLADKTDNILGSWHAFGFFAGLSSLVSLFVLEFFDISRVVKWMLGFLLFSSLAMVAVVASSNFTLIWILIGIFSLVIMVYKASLNSKEESGEGKKIKFPMVSFTVVTLSLLFVMSGQFFGSFLSTRLGINNNEVSPTLKSTLSLTKSVLQQNPILGIGPNRFNEIWSLYKPLSINDTQFWDTYFDSGSGFLPTMAATTGALGILSLLVFFVIFFAAGVRSIFSSMKRGMNYTLMAFFVIAFYLFVVSFFYPSGFVLVMLAFAFTGVFIGFSSSDNRDREISISLMNDQRKSFFAMLLLVFIMISTVVTTVKYGERFASVVYFRKALLAPSLPVVQSAISKAILLYKNDLYLRNYSQVYLLKVGEFAKREESSLTDTDKVDLRYNIDQVVSGAKLATDYNPKNYLNFQNLGAVYQNLASMGVKDANVEAIESYKTASTLNPLNPELKLVTARAYLADDKKEDAKTYANEAITLKPDYVEALIFLSKIAQSEGNNSVALSYAQKALTFLPDNKNLQEYVDALRAGSKSASIEKPKDNSSINKTP